MNYRKSEGVSRNIASGFGNQAGKLIAEQSSITWICTPPLIRKERHRLRKPLHRSRKTMAVAPLINHPHEAGAEYRASYLLGQPDSSKPFVVSW